MKSISIDQIIEILATTGNQQYDNESVTQLEHALQCATLAQKAGANQSLITACLLHDMGHLIDHLNAPHEYFASKILRSLFPPSVTQPIHLHVAAKQYLCATESNYHDALSQESKQSLKLQGGIFSPAAAAAFIQQPYAPEAVQLRRWDDRAKIPHLLTAELKHFIPILQASTFNM